MKVTLHIDSQQETRTVELENELSIGRTPPADLVLDDEGLSRVNTTVFIDGDEILVADENSTNGTFLNGQKISGPPRILRNGDRLKLGSHTNIRIEMDDGRVSDPINREPDPVTFSGPQAPANTPNVPPMPPGFVPPPASAEKPPYLLVAAALMTFLILVFGGLAFMVASNGGGQGTGASKTPPQNRLRIPRRVIDPLGGEDEDDLDDLIASWETAEQEIDVSTVADVTVMSTDTEDAELAVAASKLAESKRRALEDRPGEKGIRPAGLSVPKELFGDGVIKQKAKLREMKAKGYEQPMDFADLAAKRLSRGLIEMPMATDSYYLDVGGSAEDTPFTSFRFSSPQDEVFPIVAGSTKFDPLKRLSDNFAGQRYNLDNPADRKEMRRRLLRMFQPRAKPILQKLSLAYYQRFQRPLRVTSLTRSMDYQILLNKGNANSFKVRGEGSLPPHTSGCAFDLARKHMPAEEQNFVMKELAKMERAGELDALIEYGVNACFHVFIYDDGVAPKM